MDEGQSWTKWGMEMNINQQNRALQALVEKLDNEIHEEGKRGDKYAEWVHDLIKFIYKKNGRDALKSIVEEIDAKNGKKELIIWAADIIDEWLD